MIHIEFWKNGSKISKRFKLLVRPEQLVLYQAAKDKNWFRRDDDEDRDKPPEARQSLLNALLSSCWSRACGSEDKQVQPVLSEQTPLIPNSRMSVGDTINATEGNAVLMLPFHIPLLLQHKIMTAGVSPY